MEPLKRLVEGCMRCALHRTRGKLVFGDGNPEARILLVGEAPGAEEDRQGKPFVGRAGRLLTEVLASVGLNRSTDVFITNVVKCRPPRNRQPAPEEISQCLPYLEEQIEALKPGAIVALGKVPSAVLLGINCALKDIRGTFHSRKGIPVMPTYHPSFLLRNGRDGPRHQEARADLGRVMDSLIRQ